MFRFFETRIDPFRDHDESTPPATLFGYYGRYCRQVWPFLAALMAISLIVSLIEVTILRFIGALVDLLRSTSPGDDESHPLADASLCAAPVGQLFRQ
jgi:ATP-binding cassette subfamily B multidrug efflux pump